MVVHELVEEVEPLPDHLEVAVPALLARRLAERGRRAEQCVRGLIPPVQGGVARAELTLSQGDSRRPSAE